MDVEKSLHCKEANLSASEIYDRMKHYKNLKKDGRRSFISSAQFPFDNHLCQNCFMAVYDIPRTTFFRIRRETATFKRAFPGCVHPTTFTHGNTGRRSSTPSYLQAVAFVENYAKRYGDFMPDKDEIHLPDYS